MEFLNYTMNDPECPIKKQVPQQLIPDTASWNISQWDGIFGQNQPSQIHTTIVNAFNTYLESGNVLKRWARTQTLNIIPRAGVMFNAFYDGNALNFFYNSDSAGNLIYTCDSPDIVSHELGHAILDALRPELWSIPGMEVFSFHESFGDINAILSTLRNKEVVDYVIEETGGDLSKSNIVSRLAEQLGRALIGKNYLRDACNSFQYCDVNSLPGSGSNEILIREPHSFSRVFTGAWYDAFVNVYNAMGGSTRNECLSKTAQHMSRITYSSVLLAAAVPNFYNSVAQSFLEVDRQYGGFYHNHMLSAFQKRGILPRTFSLKSENVETKIIKGGGIERHSLGGKYKGNNFDVMLPLEFIIEQDKDNNTIKELSCSKEIALEHAQCAVDYLHENNLMGKMFKIEDGLLTRNYVCNLC